MRISKGLWLIGLSCGALSASCGLSFGGSETNPFLTVAEEFGNLLTGSSTDDSSGGGGTGGASDQFRDLIALNLVNNSETFDLKTSFVAWVNTSSIRSAEQQDALFSGGFVQLTREVRIGTVFTLPPGTFVLNGPGAAGATRALVAPGQVASFQFITPDAILVFQEPPTSCESVAFSFVDDGEQADIGYVDDISDIFEGATGGLGRKTLAQIDVYQCQPLRPGLFLRTTGGARTANEFREGEPITFDFFDIADENGRAAVVSFGEE